MYATFKAASEDLGLVSVAKDLGIHVDGEVWGDASVALGIIKRKGLGKTRHIDTGLLWVLEVAAEKLLTFGKVLGRDNPADLYTKHFDWETIARHCGRMSTTFDEGRATTAPKLYMLKAVWEVDDDDHKPVIEPIVSSVHVPSTKYEPAELGLLQPIMSLLRARPKTT